MTLFTVAALPPSGGGEARLHGGGPLGGALLLNGLVLEPLEEGANARVVAVPADGGGAFLGGHELAGEVAAHNLHLATSPPADAAVSEASDDDIDDFGVSRRAVGVSAT